MKSVYVTRRIPDSGIKMLAQKGYAVDVNPKDRPLSKKELVSALQKKKYDAILSLLTDIIDAEVMDAAPTVKIFANFAIGFNNFDVSEAKKRSIFLTNTPGGGADRVAEHVWALALALSCKIVEGDAYIRNGSYKGWDPMLFQGTKLSGKTLGIIGTGRIGADVAHKGKFGFGMNVVYYDVVRNEKIEKDFGAIFCPTVEEVLKVSDLVSLCVPLLDSTHHLMNEARFKLMKPSAFLINTARGPIIDENALVDALKNRLIAGAGLDVFEFEPQLAKGLAQLPNVVLTPHIASATAEARNDMAVLSATNVIDTLEGRRPKNMVY